MTNAPLIRPTFTLSLAVDQEEAIALIRDRFIAAPELAGRWRGEGSCTELYVPHDVRRLWSPYLSVRVDKRDGRSSLLGIFAPRPEVWTFFMFLYFLVAFIISFSATAAYVQWISREPMIALWAVWIGVPVLLLIHAASAVGARLGQGQMRSLKSEFNALLASAPALEATTG